MNRKRLQILRWSITSIPLMAVLLSAYLTYHQSGSWHYALTIAGIVAGILFGFMVLTRFGGAGLNVLSPNLVKRLDDHGHAVQIPAVPWKELSLSDVERLLLADWIQRHPPSWAGRSVTIISIAVWLAFWCIVMKSVTLTLELQVLLTFAVGVPLFILIRRIRQRIELIRSADALKHIGRCLCCHYDLKTVSQHGDDCAICPECGAAWKQR